MYVHPHFAQVLANERGRDLMESYRTAVSAPPSRHLFRRGFSWLLGRPAPAVRGRAVVPCGR